MNKPCEKCGAPESQWFATTKNTIVAVVDEKPHMFPIGGVGREPDDWTLDVIAGLLRAAINDVERYQELAMEMNRRG